MTQLLLESGIDLGEPWWNSPDYQEGELYIPGQSRLSPDEMKMLERVSAAAENNTLDIPAMPQAAMEASRLLKDPDADIADIAKIIERDPGMAANVLRFANSVMYGARFPIDTLDRAISHLGMRHMQTVVLQIAMNRISGDVEARAYAQLEWRHALACAMISRHLARLFRLDPELCYLAGLLHDIGRLPVISALHKRGFETGMPEEDNATDIIAECLHRAVGVQVAKTWELPPVIQDAIGNHLTGRLEGEESPATFPSTKVAEAAGDLCIAIGEGRFRKPFAILDAPSLRDLGFGRMELQAFLREDLPQIIEELRSGA